MSACFTPDRVNEAFLAARPLIAEQIIDLSVQHPNWLADVLALEEWPLGEATVLQQLIFRGGRPQIERGFDAWKRTENLSGCEPCEAPNCTYNWTQFGGSGFEQRLTSLMSRDFRTPGYCVKTIQSTAQFQEVFAKIMENIYLQRDFFKEFNIGQNFLTMIAKKFVVDSGGAKYNPANIYNYRNIGSVRLSALNIQMLEFFYEQMRRIPGCVPYDVVDGSPIFSLMASHQLLSRLYRDDQNLRQDVRFSGLANDLVMKYNFMSTIQGMFIAAPILYPRRFNISAGEPVEVLPFVNGVPLEVGAYTSLNPAYEAATHEEVIVHGKYPGKVFYRTTARTIGAGTDFGPEADFMTQWDWVNPQTTTDPARREGFFFASAEIGLSAQFSEGVFAVLVERPSTALMAMYTPNPVCPVAPPSCNNSVPAAGCPCPVVTNITANPITANRYYITFAVPVTGTIDAPMVLVLDSGLTLTGTLRALSADGLTAEVSFTSALSNGLCTQIVSVVCDSAATRQCSATVEYASDCRSGETGRVELILSNSLRADVDEVIVAYFGDCTTQNLVVKVIDPVTLTYTVEYATGYGPTDNPTGAGGPPPTNSPLAADMICDRGGISRVCVPPSTDATCPPCAASFTQCTT